MLQKISRLMVLILLLVTPVATMAQSTTVTGTVSDTDSQTWNNGAITFTSSATGVPLVSGSLSGTGTYSLSIPHTSATALVGDSWTVSACPQFNYACFKTTVTVSGATQTFNITPTAIRVNALAPYQTQPSAYADGEITNGYQGFQYYNVSSVSYRSCTTLSAGNCVWASGTINSQSGPGPVFNVKGYGAKGDAQFSAANCSTTSSQNTITCPGANFTSANIGMRSNCGSGLGGGLFFTAGTTITAINSSTVAQLSNTTGTGSTTASCYWGHVDDAPGGPIPTAVAAWQAAQSSTVGQGGPFNNANSPATPRLVFPAGAYLVCGVTNGSVITQANSKFGAVIEGDGGPQEAWLIPCDNAANPGAQPFMINGLSNGLIIKNISIDGIYMPVGGGSGTVPVIMNGSGHLTENLTITRWNGNAGFSTAGSGYNLNLVVNNSSVGGGAAGIICNGCNDEFHSGGSSNNGNAPNLIVKNTFGLNVGTGPRFTGNFIVDECGTATACANFINAHDVWLQGVAIFGGSPNCAHIDANSFVHWNGGICGAFGSDNNIAGPLIDAGGTLLESDVRNVGTGNQKCMTNNGTLLDNGGNTCENQFTIASGTSTGTTAVLTLNNLGAAVNANCTVGDSLVVQGAAIAGYDGYFAAGITATSATTLTYLTQGSNLGALGAGGVAMCRNLQSYSGTLPRALLNNPIPNTCYVTGTFAATVTGAPMCAFKLGSATNITAIKAASTTVTACTVAPVVTISDGTVSETLTITTAKSLWDSSVDTSTGVGTTIFKPNGTIQVTNTVGTCTTPPTNFSVSYNISPILSN